MKIYFAGFGHQIEKTDFVNILKQNWNCLLSYYYLCKTPPCRIDGGMKKRLDYIKEEKKQHENK